MNPRTFPCVVNHRIVELTEDQIKAQEWRQMTPDQKIEVLLTRIEHLERVVKEKLK